MSFIFISFLLLNILSHLTEINNSFLYVKRIICSNFEENLCDIVRIFCIYNNQIVVEYKYLADIKNSTISWNKLKNF